MELKKINNTIFERIKNIDEEGNEYWLARELKEVLGYKRWDKFCNVINNAMVVCKNSKKAIDDNFSQVGKIVKTGVATKVIKNYKLSRYACYLIVQEADSRKEVVALGKTYFLVQTRHQELLEK